MIKKCENEGIIRKGGCNSARGLISRDRGHAYSSALKPAGLIQKGENFYKPGVKLATVQFVNLSNLVRT